MAADPAAPRTAVLTVSEAAAAGRRIDESGPALEAAAARLLGAAPAQRLVLPDDAGEISRQLLAWCDEGIDLILLTGGTGVSPRDRTPEAVRIVLDIEIPGMAEKMRADTGRKLPAAYLSRQIVGARGRTLILALPGSPRGAVDCFEAVASLIPHALAVLAGGRVPHP